MKKLNYLLLGLAGLTLASCSQDDILGGGAEGNYQVRISLPSDMATRAIGDNATAASLLNYAIYDSDGNFIEANTANFPENSASMTLPLNLSAGASFKIAFFAQSPNSIEVYNFNGGSKSFTVDYSKMTSDINNADGYDCFYNLLETGTIGSTTMQTEVTLYRPVAQINWGTNDINSVVENTFGTNLGNLQATLTTSGYDTFNLLDGAVSNSTANNTVTIDKFTPSTEAFPVNGYNYVGMQYVLVSKEKEVCDLNLSINNVAGTTSNTITVSSAPVQANYRTNIYGNLLTDNIEFQVDLSADWGGADYNLPQPWDGTTEDVPVANSEGVFEIMTPAQWVGLAKAIVPTETNSKANIKTRSISNADVKLGANLDFGGYTVAPLEFTGTIDGQGYTISNATFGLSGGYASGLLDNQAVGGNITVKNLTISNVNSVNHSYDSSNAWGYTGAVIGALQNNATLTIDNVNVINANFDGIQSVGGLVGFVASGTTVNISNSSVKDSYLTNMPYVDESGFVAGLVGRPVGTVNILDGNALSNVTIKGYWAARRGESSIAQVVGGKTISNVAISNVKVTATEVTTGASVNGVSYSSLAAAVEANPSGATIQLGVGDYSTPNNFGTGDYVLKGLGAEYTIIEANNPTWNGPGSITASDLTFKSFVNSTNHTHMAFTGASNQNFTNVTFNGEFHVTSGNATFTDCTFNYDKASGTNYQLWCQTPGTVTINNCTMNCNDGKAILVYGLSAGSTGGNIVVDGLTVSSIGNKNDKAVVEVHSENYIEAKTITIQNVTYPAAYFTNGLWREIYNVAPYTGQKTTYYKVIVDGQTVQNGGATGAFQGNGQYKN